ncbi:hypothetical protein PAMP_001495 [Pampus punctatissimus]
MKYDFMRNSRWWRRSSCASAMKNLCSSHTLKPLVPVLVLVVVVIYGLAQNLRNFVANIFIPQYHYPYAVALCFAQQYSRSLGERLLVPAICNSIHAVLGMWGKAINPYAGLTPVILPLLPLLTAGLSFVLKLASLPSIHISLLLSILSGSSIAISAFKGLSGVVPLEYMYAPLALILHSLSLNWLAKVSDTERQHSPDDQASIFDIYYTQLVNQSWVLGLLWLLHPDSPWQVLKEGSWHSLLFHGYLLAILLLGMVLNFTVSILALCVSPLSAALLYSARQLLQPFILLL